MTNETPDNSQPDAAALTHGQHDFGATLSSENAAAAAQPPSTPAAPPVSDEGAPAPEPTAEPVVPPASEPVVPPAAEPVIPPVDEPLVAPTVNSASAYPPAAPEYQAPGAPAYDAFAGYPPAAPYGQAPGAAAPQDGHSAYPGGGQDATAQATNAYPGGYPANAYPATPPAPKKPMSKGLLFGIIGGAVFLVLLVAAIIIVPSLLRGPAQTASSVVEEYLTAVAEGDAETALELVDPYSDESLLTDEALAASLELAPITDIVVEESGDAERYGSTNVSASFAVGGETIERDFEVYNYGDGDWTIYDGLITANFGFEGLGLTVNGVEVENTSVSLFPGTYQLALAFDEFVIDSDTDTFTLTSDDDADVFWELQPVLTEDGKATFRSLVRASVEECVAMKTLSTPCGWDITDIDLNGDYSPVDGTVTRTITSKGQKDLDGLEPRVDYSSPTLVSTYDSVDIDMTLQGEKDGATSEFEVWFGGYMDSPSVDFAEETPTVTWD